MAPRSRFAAALLLLAPACGRVGAEERARDVLIVTIDTLRADFVSAYGAPLESTPNLDALAREGVLLADHHAVISLTAPSHLSMFTGLLPTEHGLRTNGPRFPDHLTYLPDLLARAGYRAGAFMGASILRSKAGFARGFEVFDEVDSGTQRHGNFFERPAVEVVDRALEFLRGADERPTLLWVHLYDPHEPYLADARWLRTEDEARAAFAGQIEPSELVDDARQLQWRRGYEAEVRSTDHELGRLLAAWDGAERGRQGLVIVTSDHGQGLGEHDYSGHGFHLYQEQLLVPFVARMRGRLPADRRVDAPTTALDLARTVIDLLGMHPSDLGGRSLVPLLTGRESAGRPALLAERRELNGQDFEPQEIQRLIEAKAGRPGTSRAEQLVLVRAPWKFLWTADGGRELYHLERDPAELDNRAAVESELTAAFEREIEAWRSSVQPGVVDEELSEETVRALRALGY
jgi:arylsulfatase A-like enzyme